MNNIQGINAATPQMTFKAKTGNRKAIHEFIDKSNDLAMEFLNKNRPLEEKREIAVRRALSNLKIKSPYFGYIVECGKATIERIRAYNDRFKKIIMK